MKNEIGTCDCHFKSNAVKEYLFIYLGGDVHQEKGHLLMQGTVSSHTLYSQNTSSDWINTVICLLGLGSNPRFFNVEQSAKDLQRRKTTTIENLVDSL